MLTQVENEDDLKTWADTPELDLHTSDDAATLASESLERIAELLGQKTILKCTNQLIFMGVNRTDSWQFRQAGFTFLGMISEACEKKFKKEFDDILALIAKGMTDEHPRVRYQALMALGLILNVASPNVQLKFHADLMNCLFKMVSSEQFIKSKAQAVSATINFVRGLIEPEEGGLEIDEEELTKHKSVLEPYIENLVLMISSMLELSIAQNYMPLIEETLGLLTVMAEVLTDQFAGLYSKFMPGLKQILAITPQETKQQKELRSSCIQTIGSILESVKDTPEVCRADAFEITQGLTQHVNNLDESDP